jgi:hypothetical protein
MSSVSGFFSNWMRVGVPWYSRSACKTEKDQHHAQIFQAQTTTWAHAKLPFQLIVNHCHLSYPTEEAISVTWESGPHESLVFVYFPAIDSFNLLPKKRKEKKSLVYIQRGG